MNIVTHALLPVIMAGLYERSYQIPEDRKGVFSPKQLVAIGVFGILPDLLHPHISLEARYSSLSHGVLFWLVLTIALLLFSFLKRKMLPFYLAGWFSAAYLLHLFCDAISGGITWLYPLGADVLGAYYIQPIWWIPIDIISSLLAYSMFRIIPHILSKRKK